MEEGEEDNAATNNAAPNDYAKNYFGDFFNSEEQETPSHNEPVSVVWWCTFVKPWIPDTGSAHATVVRDLRMECYLKLLPYSVALQLEMC